MVAAVTAAGCSGKGVKKVSFRGTVSYQGHMLRSGQVTFYGPAPERVIYSAARIQPDGSFMATDVVPGEVTVTYMDTPQGSGSPGAPDQPKGPPVSVHEKYRDPVRSGLQYTITSDTTELPIEIQ
jgi:hypothetical protein